MDRRDKHVVEQRLPARAVEPLAAEHARRFHRVVPVEFFQVFDVAGREILPVVSNGDVDLVVIFVPGAAHRIEGLLPPGPIDPVGRAFWIAGRHVLLRARDALAAADLDGDRAQVLDGVAAGELVDEGDRRLVAAHPVAELVRVRGGDEHDHGPAAVHVRNPDVFVMLGVVLHVGELDVEPLVQLLAGLVAVAVLPAGQDVADELVPGAALGRHRLHPHENQAQRVRVLVAVPHHLVQEPDRFPGALLPIGQDVAGARIEGLLLLRREPRPPAVVVRGLLFPLGRRGRRFGWDQPLAQLLKDVGMELDRHWPAPSRRASAA